MFSSKTIVQGHQIYGNSPFESLAEPVALCDVSAIGVYLKKYTQRKAKVRTSIKQSDIF